MPPDALKLSVAKEAVKHVPKGSVVGVGTGSTTNLFIDELAQIRNDITGAVASSEATAARLSKNGIKVIDLVGAPSIPVYIDGADEITGQGAMIKGGGGALTREKIIASSAGLFICIADESKLVQTLGAFPLPVEVIPMAHEIITQRLLLLGGQATLRRRVLEPFVTDNGNFILDVTGLDLGDPVAMEERINNMPGVVTVGLFAIRGADICLLGTGQGVRTMHF